MSRLWYIILITQWSAIFLQSLIVAQAKAEEPFLGVSLQGIDSKTAEALNLKSATGVLIRDIALGGAANCDGLRRGDLIVEYANEKIDTLEKLVQVASKTKPGQTISALVIRDGQRKRFDLVLSKIHESWKVKDTSSLALPQVGLTLIELSPKIRERFDVRWGALGVLVTLVNPKLEKHVPLKRGDIIVQVNQKPVWMTEQIDRIYKLAQKNKKKSVVLLVERAGDFRFFFLPVKE